MAGLGLPSVYTLCCPNPAALGTKPLKGARSCWDHPKWALPGLRWGCRPAPATEVRAQVLPTPLGHTISLGHVKTGGLEAILNNDGKGTHPI